MTVQVKICGLTRREDVLFAVRFGADFVGVVVGAPDSPRNRAEREARLLIQTSSVPVVLVTRRHPVPRIQDLVRQCQPAILQIHTVPDLAYTAELVKALPCPVWAAVPMPPVGKAGEEGSNNLLSIAQGLAAAGCQALVLDTKTSKHFGGGGVVGDWQFARRIIEKVSIPCLLAGGLTADTVAEAVRTARPWGVDVSSGVELKLGIKSPELIRRFIQEAKGAS
ncbi:MAG: phosphoribosylanthranilate isomerase [Armatimonadetes bacterium]|nr:phosphoribosylanthranilate isomerase [Armatimonadota bacterium]MDW8120716.1 phosphoribosylanthranilate isomerase [Armatimonadota bacterium]